MDFEPEANPFEMPPGMFQYSTVNILSITLTLPTLRATVPSNSLRFGLMFFNFTPLNGKVAPAPIDPNANGVQITQNIAPYMWHTKWHGVLPCLQWNVIGSGTGTFNYIEMCFLQPQVQDVSSGYTDWGCDTGENSSGNGGGNVDPGLPPIIVSPSVISRPPANGVTDLQSWLRRSLEQRNQHFGGPSGRDFVV